MNKKIATLLLLVSGITNAALAAEAYLVVENKVPDRCESFGYACQSVGGYLGERIRLNQSKGLLEVAYYNYTRGYRPSVEVFWPCGEYLGKYVEALATAYRYSADQRLLEHQLRIVDSWLEAQAADGYLGTARKLPRDDRWDGWTTWEHGYVLRGLLAYYDVSVYDRRRFGGRDQSALDAAAKLGTLLAATYGDGRGKRDLMRTGFHGLGGGSVLEPMIDLYRRTGDREHLEFCRYALRAFEQPTGPQIVTELTQRSGKVNQVKSRKAYEMLTCILGILKMYRLTGEKAYLETAERAWTDIVEHRLYITGTATQDEGFGDDHFLPADENDDHINRHGQRAPIDMGEACVTVHWMDLNRELFQLSGDLKYVEEYEKSLYNHLLGSQHPASARQSYYTPLIGHKDFRSFNPYGGKPPCCVSSVARCLTQIPEMVWTRFADGGLALLLYESGRVEDTIKTMDGKDVQLRLDVTAEVNDAGQVRITVRPEEPATFRLALRVPSWVSSFEVRLSDGESLAGKPGHFCEVNRRWSETETLTISMRIRKRVIEGGPTYAGYHAFRYGPYVLALDAALNPQVGIDRVAVAANADLEASDAPEHLPPQWMGNQFYSLTSVDGQRLTLVPFLDAGQTGARYRVWMPGGAKVLSAQ